LARERALALAETTATGVLWGTSFPVIGYGISLGIDPRVFAFLRFATAAPVMVLFARIWARPLFVSLRLKPVWILGLLNSVGFLCQFLGQAYTQASVAALLINLSVLIAAVGSAALLGERFTKVKAAGTLLAVAGILLLTTKGDASSLNGGQLTGDILYLVSAALWGGYIIYNKRKTDETKWDPFGVTTAIVLLTAIFISPVMLTVNLGQVQLGGAAWSLILYTALVNTAIPFVLYQMGLRFLSATASSILLMLEIVTAVLISAILLGEVLTPLSLIGAGSIVASIFLVSSKEASARNLFSNNSSSSKASGGSGVW